MPETFRIWRLNPDGSLEPIGNPFNSRESAEADCLILNVQAGGIASGVYYFPV